MLRSILLLLCLISTVAQDVGPGDVADWSTIPQWWTTMKESTPELRKCYFVSIIPDTGDRCPGILQGYDHYYCVYGTQSAPTWYCTCIEQSGDYVFHCNGNGIKTVDDLENVAKPALPADAPQYGTPPEEDHPKYADVPGDQIDWTQPEPMWWQDLKAEMANHELRKCVFLNLVPSDGDSCPGVAEHSDHYYCVYGTDLAPTWFCTCLETEFKFSCSSDHVLTPEELGVDPTLPVDNKNPDSTPPPTATPGGGSGTTVDTPVDPIPGSGGGGNDSVGTSPVSAGDDIVWSGQGGEPQWWHDMKEDLGDELKKCVFLSTVPYSGDTCPGVAEKQDHYFCIFGSQIKPTWFCTCVEMKNDYQFHCNGDEITTPEKIPGVVNSQVRTSGSKKSGGGFAGGFFTAVAFLLVGFIGYKYVQNRRDGLPGFPDLRVQKHEMTLS